MKHNNITESNHLDSLRETILAKVDKDRMFQSPPPSRQASLLLGSLLEAYLINKNYLPENLAKALNVETEFVEALIEGMIPALVIHDDLLVDIAHAISYEPNLLRIILNREIEPYSDRKIALHEPSSNPQDADPPINTRLYYCGDPACPGHGSFSVKCQVIPHEVSILRQYEDAYRNMIDEPEPTHLVEEIVGQLKQQNEILQSTHEQLETEVQHLRRELRTLREASKALQETAYIPTEQIQSLEQMIEDYEKWKLVAQLEEYAARYK